MADIKCVYIECYVYKRVKNDIKFLVIKRSNDSKVYPGIWQTVTGKIEKGEKAFNAARREVTEETGLHPVRLFSLPHTTTFYSSHFDSISLIPLFFCEVKNEKVKLSEEHSEYKWLSAKSSAKILFFKTQKENINFIYSNFKKNKKFKSFEEINL